MDYFSLDLMVLLLSWHSISIPEQSEKKLISRLFQNLMRRCYDENRAILKNNLELLKTMTECWKDAIEVPSQVIYNLIKSNDPKKVATGIQLFGVVLTNNISNFIYPQDFGSLDFFKQLMTCIKNNSKTIHASASEVRKYFDLTLIVNLIN